jgi:hypothetical protein
VSQFSALPKPHTFNHGKPVAYPGIFFGGGGGATNSVEERGQRERGSGGGSPLIRGSAQFAIRFDFVKLSGCRGLLQMYFPRNWEFGSALSKLGNFGGGLGLNPRNPPSRYVTVENRSIYPFLSYSFCKQILVIVVAVHTHTFHNMQPLNLSFLVAL